MKRAGGSVVDLAATLKSSQQSTSLSSSLSTSAATATVTDVRFTPSLTTLWTNGDPLRQALPFSK